MTDYVARIHEENALLAIKIERLEAFILSEEYDRLPEIDRLDLKEQLRHMRAYSTVLGRRISRRCNAA